MGVLWTPKWSIKGNPKSVVKGKPKVRYKGKTQSPLGPRPKGLGGQTKSELGKDLGVHKIGTSKVVILVLRYNRYKMVS